MKKFLTFLIFIIASFALGVVFASPRDVLAQENPDEIAKKYGITFPIAELGNCTDYSSCRTYCEDPVNSSTCIDFAKKKGFYHEEDTGKADLLAKAKSQLGCSSEASCREFCSKEENFEKCDNFARQNNLSGGHIDDPGKAEILQKAKSILGCSSEATCREVCSKEENRERCSQFARQTGLRGGEHQSGPGGCNSEETCRAFCENPSNYQICSGYSSSQGGNFSGPGGCTSESTCRAYCESNPDKCGGSRVEENYGYNASEICQKTPNCSWSNNTCTCQSGNIHYDNYCQENPDKCKYDSSQAPSGTYTQPTYAQSSDYSSECTKNGCNWTGSTCDCSNKTETQYQPQDQTQQTYDPATECSKQTDCSWTGTSCQCGGVQGATTNESLLQKVLNFFRNIFP